jgi:hypothetical protein
MRRARAHWLLPCAVLLVACGSPIPPPPPKVAPIATARPGLLEHVPAAGLRWLVVGRPSALENRPDLASLLRDLFPPVRLDAFRKVTGVNLAKVKLGAVAAYQIGTLYLAELGEPAAKEVRERFSERLDDGGIARQPRPAVHRLSGTSRESPRALLTVDDDFVAVAVDDTVLVRIVEAYAARRLRSPSALNGVALQNLPPFPVDALVALYAAGPFPDDVARGAHGVLAQTTSLSITLSGSTAEHLTATLTLVGDYAPDPREAGERLALAFKDLGASSTGTLIGLASAGSAKVVADLHQLTLTAELPLRPLVRGLHAAISGDVYEIFQLVPPSSAGEPAQSP